MMTGPTLTSANHCAPLLPSIYTHLLWRHLCREGVKVAEKEGKERGKAPGTEAQETQIDGCGKPNTTLCFVCTAWGTQCASHIGLYSHHRTHNKQK